MIPSVRHMATCRWSARRLDRYVDQDPSAPLTSAEEQRLERHLRVCARCAASADDLHRLKAALARYGARRGVDVDVRSRLEDLAAHLSSGASP